MKKRFTIKIEIKDGKVIIVKTTDKVNHVNEIMGSLHLIIEEILEKYDYED